MSAAELRMDLFDFERIVAIGHAASDNADRIVNHAVRIRPHPRGIQADATDSFVIAHRIFEKSIESHLDEALMIPSSGLSEVMGAIRQMVKIERGKYDPMGWRIVVDYGGDDIDVVAYNSFKENRGSVIVSKVDGDFPDFSKIADMSAEAIAEVGLNPELLVRLAKSTGHKDARLGCRFTGPKSVVHVRATSHDLRNWSGMLMPISLEHDLWEAA